MVRLEQMEDNLYLLELDIDNGGFRVRQKLIFKQVEVQESELKPLPEGKGMKLVVK